MTVLAYPSITPNASRWGLVSNTGRFSSLSNVIQTLDRSGEYWQIELRHTALREADRAVAISFLAQLNGAENRFTVHDHSHTQRGAFGGTPLINGVDQTGTSVDIDGCSNSITNWIREGDHIGFADRLYVATADASSDGLGEITVPVRPRIRTAPPDDAVVTTTNPTARFVLENPASLWSNRPGGFIDLVIQAREDVALGS